MIYKNKLNKMRTKKYIIFLMFFLSGYAFSQIGINTSNSQGQFTIDAAKDNPATGTPNATQQLNDFTVISNGNVGVGTNSPTSKLHINNSTNGALRIVNGTEGNGKLLVSDNNGIGTWQSSSPPVVINSTIGGAVNIGTSYAWVGSAATVTIPGYYLISPKLLTDKTPVGCGVYIAYNLSTSSTVAANQPYVQQDAHFASGTIYDFIYSANVGYLQAGTYYMLVRNGGGCTSNVTRINAGQNSFSLILLK